MPIEKKVMNCFSYIPPSPIKLPCKAALEQAERVFRATKHIIPNIPNKNLARKGIMIRKKELKPRASMIF